MTFSIKRGLTKTSLNSFKFIFLVFGDRDNQKCLRTNKPKRENRKFYISNVYAVFDLAYKYVFSKEIARAAGAQEVH